MVGDISTAAEVEDRRWQRCQHKHHLCETPCPPPKQSVLPCITPSGSARAPQHQVLQHISLSNELHQHLTIYKH